jgi:hypothetical protein
MSLSMYFAFMEKNPNYYFAKIIYFLQRNYENGNYFSNNKNPFFNIARMVLSISTK